MTWAVIGDFRFVSPITHDIFFKREELNMLTFYDDVLARTRHNEMLKEAEEQRRFAHFGTQVPNVFQHAFAALKGAFASKRSQPAARDAHAPTKRKTLATE
jgi:hypothetical protein